MKKIVRVFGTVLLIGFIGIVGYNYFSKVINERGFLGMDKYGRKHFIQQMNILAEINPGTEFVDESEDFSFLERIWQEPMSTILRQNLTYTEREYVEYQVAKSFGDIPINAIDQTLETPADSFLFFFPFEEIVITDEITISKGELINLAKDKKAWTYRDLLRGFGFTRYEVYINGQMESEAVLNPNLSNGTETNLFYRIGSLENDQ